MTDRPTANWTFKQAPLGASNGVEVVPQENGDALSYAEVLRLLRESEAFSQRFSAVIAEAPYRACFWEVCPVTRKSANRPFTFVVIDAPSLAGVLPDSRPFADYLSGKQPVVTFENLGGDATLVVPTPVNPGRDRFAHLADFLRSAPQAVVHAFWRAVAIAVEARVGKAPLWLSTSGLGVFWLHARLDSRPKYYTHAAYRSHSF